MSRHTPPVHRRRYAVANTSQPLHIETSSIRTPCRKCEAHASRASAAREGRGESLRLVAHGFVSRYAAVARFLSDMGLPTLRGAAMHVFSFVDRRGAHRASHAGRVSFGRGLGLGLAFALLAGCATRPPGPPDAAVPDSLRG
ncbi:hypothetical protein F3J11_38805, partial [Burkholderia sp. Cy-647]|nr:hypothetical protein [Burkholderia sp. Cy-647]